jgi:hypothetical protein
MKQLKPLIITFFILALAVFAIVYAIPTIQLKVHGTDEERKGGKEMVLKNYGAAIDSAAHVFNINPSYLKALCYLECSGRKVFDHRFEPHVFRKLKNVKFNMLDNYEHVTPNLLMDANDEALKNLASSWGPFQLMGYKCLLLNIKVRDIRGDESVFYGVKWIDMTYGKYLREGKYRDAFHIHNTGMVYPKNGKARTYDPDYCERGIELMAWFDQHPNG